MAWTLHGAPRFLLFARRLRSPLTARKATATDERKRDNDSHAN